MKTDAYQHTDAQRRKIPTSEDHVYLGEDERKGVPFSPEPGGSDGPIRLSWRRGVNSRAIQTDALPLYIHEKVHPSAFVEQLASGKEEDGHGDFFADFNDFPEVARYGWYRHDGNWSNRLIRGNSVDVMASLAVREQLSGQVQMIFFDPPYGINFDSNYQPTTRKRGGKEAPIEGASRRAFRDTYRDGPHSYLDAIFSVAVHARALLAPSGSFFLQMGTENVHRLSVVLDEVFGAENRIATIAFAKSGATSATHLPQVADWLLWYARDRERVKYHQLYEPLSRKEKIDHMSWHAMVEEKDGTCRKLTTEERNDPEAHLPVGARMFRRMPLASQGESTTGRSDPYKWQDTLYPCPPGHQWSVSHEGLDSLASQGRLITTDGKRLSWKRYEDEVPGRQMHNLWPKQQSATDMRYVVETAKTTIERCIQMTTDPGDLVLDPTCGSGTTALVAERWGRRWITIDTSAIPIALCRQRILSSVHKWFYTLDDPQGQAMEQTLDKGLGTTDSRPMEASVSGSNPASGFVYKRTRYVSAGHLAYNKPIKTTLLVNQPESKKGIRRISSPFTVESHSPWVYLSSADARENSGAGERDVGIRENVVRALETSGIPVPSPESKDERWRFEGLRPWLDDPRDGRITHEATLRGSGERVALALVPDDRSAGAPMVNDLARDAVRLGFDKLIIVAFHFEPGVDRERRGKLEVLTVRANRDLTIGELESGREDNAFVLVGEPDVEVDRSDDGCARVKILGYQVYDPASGNVRPSGDPRDIDCWMLDTNYDGESFCARRVHFPGKDQDRQIKRFKRELARHIDPNQWAFMTSLESAPFKIPDNGKVAVRIVTQFGDEMLTVVPIQTG